MPAAFREADMLLGRAKRGRPSSWYGLLAWVVDGYNVQVTPFLLHRFLIIRGYETAYREDGFAECLLVHGDERWLGRGPDRERALLDAVAQAFPSSLARTLLEKAIEDLEKTVEPAELQGVEQEPLYRSPTQPSPPLETALPQTLTALAEANVVVEVSEEQDSKAPISRVVPSSSAIVRTTLSEEEALTKLSELRATIESDAEELGLCAPPRQRLVLLAWMARARSYQDDAPPSSRIYDAVRAFAKTIGQLAKDWWPGNVPALQITSRPVDALKTLPPPDSAPPMTWGAVADLAELALRQMEQEDSARDRDDYGWADTQRLLPAPEDADEVLREMLAQIEKIAPLGRLPEAGEVPSADRLLEWVRKLRWVRDGVEDVRTWGRIAGRLRFWARKEREASKELEPTFIPDRPWAFVLRAEAMATADAQRKLEEETRRAEELGRVLEEAPRPEASPTTEELAAWLAKALPFTDTFQAEVANAMLPFRDQVLSLDVSNIEGADRRIRRRLAKLRESLDNPASIEHPPASTRRAVSVVQPVEELVTEASSPNSELRRRVVEHTRGRRAVFVSNRADEDLRERVGELFDFEVLDWVEAEPRRIDALADTIAAGAYDFVLGATGFMDHTVDGKLSRACKRTSARYIRVNRGRPTACLRAVARSLGELNDAA